MGPRFLSVPDNIRPSVYAASTANLRTLYAALAGVSQDVAINQAGEGFSVEMPDISRVAKFINSDGVYVDYCGIPMWYSYYGTYGWQPNNIDFSQFLTDIGVDPAYIKSFDPGNCGVLNPDIFNCVPCTFSGYPYNRGAVSTFAFPASNSAMVAPAATPPAKASCTWNISGQAYHVYSVIGIKAGSGSGWYFYAYSNTSGTAVSPTAYADFIRQMLGYGSSTGGGGGTGGGGTPGSPSGGGFLSNLTTADKFIGAGVIMAALVGVGMLFTAGGK